MPWLLRDEEDSSNSLLFVHVPRCGGTSLAHHFKTTKKCRKGLDPYHKIGMIYFFYRYKLLESANFPIITWENLLALIELIIGTTMWFVYLGRDEVFTASFTMWSFALFSFICSTFLFTAPVSARNQFVRRFYGIFVGKIMCNFTASEKWITGVNRKGYLVHFTAANMLKHNLVKEDDLNKSDSFAIVRNPYSRLVSIYMYNRMGPLESFDHFIRDWINNKMKIYRETGSTSEWDIYCHALPGFEFTHLDGKQIVKSIIKQEELGKLFKPGSLQSTRHINRLREIPEKVAEALQGMPHSNQRKRSKPWWDYYTQETQDMVAKAYVKDFLYFAYDFELPNRPDLCPPNVGDIPDDIMPFSPNLNFNIYKPGDITRASADLGEGSKLFTKEEIAKSQRQLSEIQEPENTTGKENDSVVIDCYEADGFKVESSKGGDFKVGVH